MATPAAPHDKLYDIELLLQYKPEGLEFNIRQGTNGGPKVIYDVSFMFSIQDNAVSRASGGW